MLPVGALLQPVWPVTASRRLHSLGGTGITLVSIKLHYRASGISPNKNNRQNIGSRFSDSGVAVGCLSGSLHPSYRKHRYMIDTVNQLPHLHYPLPFLLSIMAMPLFRARATIQIGYRGVRYGVLSRILHPLTVFVWIRQSCPPS